MAYSPVLIIFIILIMIVGALLIVFTFYMNNWLCFENAPRFWCLKDNYEELSSVQVTEIDDDESLSGSDFDGGMQKDQTDARTIAAEVQKVGEGGNKDDEAKSDSSDDIQKFGIVLVSFKFEMMRSLLTIIFHGVKSLPDKNNGGPSAYQIFVVIFDESEKKLFRWNSTEFTPNSFKAEQKLEFPEMSAKDISTTAVRIRLYGCERKRRDSLLGETVVGLGNVNLKKQDQYELKMEKRAELKHKEAKSNESPLFTKQEKVVKTVKVTPIKSFFNNKSETNSNKSSSESNVSHIFVTRTNPIIKNPFIRAHDDEKKFAKEMAEKGKFQVEDPLGLQPELLLGLGYNPITGRLTVEVVKGNSFKNPLSRADDKLPNSYVKVTVCAANNQEITRSKTELRRNQANPLFKEKFMFQIPEFQLAEVTLMFGVYHKKSSHRKEIIGWVSVGLHNTSDEELNHWNSMLGSNGEEVFQWHLLQKNTISRHGLPGAD